MLRLLTIALALLLATQVLVAAPARGNSVLLQVESASTRQETCAKCYELSSVCNATFKTFHFD